MANRLEKRLEKLRSLKDALTILEAGNCGPVEYNKAHGLVRQLTLELGSLSDTERRRYTWLPSYSYTGVRQESLIRGL
jgi:hypothetical protein